MNINSTSSSSGSTTDYSRITGLATGMDTDNMVKQMMAADQTRIDKAKQNEQYTEWQQEAYVGIIKDLKDFYNSYLDISSTSDTNMMKSAAYNGMKATVSDTDSNYIQATALPGAVKGNYSVKITQLATADTYKSSASIPDTFACSNGTIKIAVDGVNYSIATTTSMKINDLVSALQSATTATGDSILNHVNINYSELTKKITIEGKTLGDTSALDISELDSNGAVTTTGTLSSLGLAKTEGHNALVQIKPPGEATDYYPVSKDSNSFSVDNVKYDLQNMTGQDGMGNDITATVTVKTDSTDSIAKIKKFVDAYNTLISNISSKISEKKNYDYKPLTDAQKATMSTDQITKWETEAKKGILSNESGLSNLLYSIRKAVYSEVDGAGIDITQIGITTTSVIDDGGKLEVNEDKLKNALENRSDQVYRLFTQSGSTDNEKGILQKFKDVFNSNVGTDGILIQKAGYEDTRWVISNELSKSITSQKQKISDMLENFKEKQQRYYNMFATLESNMNRLNSQSSWLTSALGQG